MTERHGVRVGQRVRDVDGRPLGRVKALYDWGFRISKGLPILFRRDFVVRYDEVRGVRDGALVIARSDRDLFDVARGDVPRSWRIPAPPEFPAAATPSEAQGVFEELAAGAIATGGEVPAAAPRPAPPPPAADGEYERTRGQSAVPPPAELHQP